MATNLVIGPRFCPLNCLKFRQGRIMDHFLFTLLCFNQFNCASVGEEKILLSFLELFVIVAYFFHGTFLLGIELSYNANVNPRQNKTRSRSLTFDEIETRNSYQFQYFLVSNFHTFFPRNSS